MSSHRGLCCGGGQGQALHPAVLLAAVEAVLDAPISLKAAMRVSNKCAGHLDEPIHIYRYGTCFLWWTYHSIAVSRPGNHTKA